LKGILHVSRKCTVAQWLSCCATNRKVVGSIPAGVIEILDLPENSVTSSGIVKGVSDHQVVIVEVEWEESFSEPHVKRVVSVYNRTDVSCLEIFLCDKFVIWASNGSNVEDIWNYLKNIVYGSIERFLPQTTLKKIADRGYCKRD